jgi:DNA-binding transcriptional MerR regulator
VYIDAENMERFDEAEVNAVAEAVNTGRMPHIWVKTPATTPQNILDMMRDLTSIPVGTPGTMSSAEEQTGNGIEIGLDSLADGAKTAEVKSTLKDIIEKQVKGPAYIFLRPGVLEGQKVTDANSATYRIIQSGKELVGEVQGIVKDLVKTLNRPLTPEEMYENAYNGALVLESLIRGIDAKDAKAWNAVNGKLKGIDEIVEKKGLQAAYTEAVKAIGTLDENAKARIGKTLRDLHAAALPSSVDKAQLAAYKAELLGFVHSLRTIALYNRYIASMNERAVPDNAEKMKRVRGLLLKADNLGVNVEEIQKLVELQELKFADADIQALLDYVRGKIEKPQAALRNVEQKLRQKQLTPAEAMVYVKAVMKIKENESYKAVTDEVAGIINPFINDIAARKRTLPQSTANQWAITEMLYLLDTIDNWKKLSVIEEIGPNMNMNTVMSMLGAA